ncbi:MAG TPA: hypothetical protein VJN18_30460 [Polyangiaceae bacterium]|nr:hypothetical protein [Polyangiaceae bacterium]
MATITTLAPIAAQLARAVSLEALFPRGAIEDVLRDHRGRPETGEAELPEEVKPFFGHYCVVVRAAAQLLGAPAFDSLARFHDEVEEEYMPGGPPQSPVYDSFSMQFVLGSVRQGIGNETPYSVLARLLQRDPSRSRLQCMAQSLADARFELYRVRSTGDHRADIEPVRGGTALSVRLTGPFLRTGDFGLMRVLPFDNEHFIADSPYLLKASAQDWLDHLARIVVQQQALGATSASQKASKLSSKEQARRRQKEKAKAARNEPEEIIKRYLQFGLSDRYWFDYVMDAYAGERRGIVVLAGVPDRPELLPHSTEYQNATEPDLPPQLAFRQSLLRIAVKEGLLDFALRELRRLADGAEPELSPNEQNLLAAYASFGLRSKDGTTVLTRFERSHDAESVHPDVRAFLNSLKNGWFTVLRVDRIHLDKGLEAFDLLRRQKLQVSERAATRQLAPSDLVSGWLCKDSAGTITLEGGIAHVPSFGAPPFMSLVEQLRRAMPPLADEQAWKDSAAELPLPLIAGILELRANPPLPELVNTSGDPLELVTGHYRVRDRARVVATLGRELAQNGDGSYGWIDDAGTALAHIELSSGRLRVQVNSRNRLKAAQKHLEALLGDSIARSLEAHEDVEQALRARKGNAGKARPQSPPLELPPEVAAQVHDAVLAKIRSTLDESIPQFKGKTLRQLARSAKDRPDAISWLREQERILKSNPQLAGLDMRPLWQELALPFQGLETDPPR